MSGFFFNFSVEKEVSQETGSYVRQVPEESDLEEHENSNTDPLNSFPKSHVELKDDVTHTAAKEVSIKDWHKELASKLSPSLCLHSIPVSGMTLKYIDDSSHILEIIAACNSIDCPSGLELKSLLGLSDSHHSDLIPGVYEGGLKTWECTFDLVAFMAEISLDTAGKTVLELGCGAGLPGIFSVISGAESVHFQDYNLEVLEYITIPSLLCNNGNFGNNETTFRFYSGDWNQLPSLVPSDQHYDIILTSETIYSPSSQPQLLSALRALSRASTGVVFVAAKCVYFGVGGTVEGFCRLVEEDGMFNVEEVWRISTGVPRVVLKLTHKKHIAE